MITLKDIAKEAGLSVAQVSRALNDHDDVSKETKQKVEDIANSLGYVKNISAHRLVMGVSNRIDFVVQGFTDEDNMLEHNEFYAMINGVNKYANEKRYEVIIYILQPTEKSYVQFFRERGIRNAILYGFEYDDPKFQELLSITCNMVCIDIPINGENKGSVIVNNTHYCTQAVEAIINSGKQNIALLTGSPHAVVSIEREAGYRIALTKKKLPIKENYIVDADFRQSVAYEKTLYLLQQNPEIDAFFCISDYMAIGCMEAILSIGKVIPDDIAVMGFDDIPISRYVTPKLSTVKQYSFNKGFEAAKLLIQIENKEQVNPTVILNCEMQLRDSI
ncbi:MAG: hypothetical protein ATN36_02810 [Epulopiscium sp. Nele67-Bin005]|nr:MAG: hypothetical protein ATN36_02810 [Epulopiscium sp. Nele67-Bin005]